MINPVIALDILGKNGYNGKVSVKLYGLESDGFGDVSMKRHEGEDRIVFQSLAMVTQFGLNMIVPICMMSALGVWLDGKLGTSWLTILFFVLGAVAGGQNVYRIAKRMYGAEGTDRGQGVSDEDDRSGETDE